ncbi:oxygen-independent coproporphyrinogen-3 oxidase [Muriicola jejuensis]|uniref:Heme chaperone HemW n=1 Tax=Muriicola jejuensis TaxID=504488 RepID=A0A6P0U8S9_9FLAO|nr:radical SAM family heme chaperone HemW [Muriicola jejuensis]NER09575.1 radical SAM family heme chaperone HemW [Muriicola jejuensis]SMP07657.1 oxygen-independent coproporphyrinogen-3 oxidase [Muriicola jejuensis]
MAGVYIHIPFCKQACHYCDFHFSTSLKKKEEMLLALEKELLMRKEELTGQVVDTIYFGGGTPSVLDTQETDRLIQTVLDHYVVGEDPEITLEANPDDLSSEKLGHFAVSKVNRLSIGVQSFFDEDLRFMNRAHNAEQARATLAMAREQFDNISIDLIYGIPIAEDERWKQNIEIALSYQVPHISSYALTVEPGTALKKFIDKGIVPEVDDEKAEAQFRHLVTTLESAGFLHYELSNFGKPGYFSRNNTAYWQGKTYLGIGPSAHSFNGQQRSWNISNNTLYIKGIQQGRLPAETEILTQRDLYNEYVMTGLRTMWGVSLQRIEQEFGSHFREYLLRQAERHLEDQYLYLDGDTLRVSLKGKFLSDGLAADLFMLPLEKKT